MGWNSNATQVRTATHVQSSASVTTVIDPPQGYAGLLGKCLDETRTKLGHKAYTEDETRQQALLFAPELQAFGVPFERLDELVKDTFRNRPKDRRNFPINVNDLRAEWERKQGGNVGAETSGPDLHAYLARAEREDALRKQIAAALPPLDAPELREEIATIRNRINAKCPHAEYDWDRGTWVTTIRAQLIRARLDAALAA